MRHARGVADTLTAVTSQWPTPRTITVGAESAERKQELGRTESGGGDLQAVTLTWPRPMSRDHRSGHTQKTDEELWGTKGKPLERVATTFLSSPPAPTTPYGGESSKVRRSLNPLFVEWLMGWPMNWTLADRSISPTFQARTNTSNGRSDIGSIDCEPAETECSVWLRRMRGELSRLVSPPEFKTTLF